MGCLGTTWRSHSHVSFLSRSQAGGRTEADRHDVTRCPSPWSPTDFDANPSSWEVGPRGWARRLRAQGRPGGRGLLRCRAPQSAPVPRRWTGHPHLAADRDRCSRSAPARSPALARDRHRGVPGQRANQFLAGRSDRDRGGEHSRAVAGRHTAEASGLSARAGPAS